MRPIPPQFLDSCAQFVPIDGIEAFVNSLEQTVPTSIRLNPKKSTHQFDNFEKVSWCEKGRYLPERPVFTLDPLFWAGVYYVQEASSMFVGEALRQILPDKSACKILDMCAAPGGKSTHIASLIGENHWLISNEIIKSRVGILEENLMRWGSINVSITSLDAKDFGKVGELFDIVVIDAPCSGEGMFRKEEIAREEWSLDNIAMCAARQKRILFDILPSIKEEGYLIYSTCTFNQEENEKQIAWLLEQGFECVKLELSGNSGIVEVEEVYSEKKVIAYRFYPHLVKGEGFFLACLQKKIHQPITTLPIRKTPFKYESVSKKNLPLLRNWIKSIDDYAFYTKNKQFVFAFPVDWEDEILEMEQKFNIKKSGLWVGEFKGNDFVPAHDLALSQQISEEIPSVRLNKEQALDYLRKAELVLSEQLPALGWVTVNFEGHFLGWIKILPNRINNYYPAQWRIKHL